MLLHFGVWLNQPVNEHVYGTAGPLVSASKKRNCSAEFTFCTRRDICIRPHQFDGPTLAEAVGHLCGPPEGRP
jgi:hypothetical protein